MSFQTVSETQSFGGIQGYYSHASETLGCEMRFSVFTPPQAKNGKVPVLWYLSGLTCTEDNATVKAGFQRVASELGLMIICPDTSPRGDDVPDDEGYDFGKGAGFYVDATEEPWAKNFQMYSYITKELPALVSNEFAADMNRQGITGHSMGGHGALTIWLKNRDTYKSISAFAPIVSTLNCPWGEKALTGYISENRENWAEYDACALLEKHGASDAEILIDQGLADNFLEGQLKPELLKEACEKTGQKLNLRMQEGYDHSYFFIASFIEDHLRHHAAALRT
ncbi:S-formylglutathione hydrolase [Kordiimonas sp. SCSIO 12603]|uniref:S-formylglutathione hydrolase n=1 Tax=Kordiimonas sp. SCSIO 12603 TaxID=2829596 RepID=UPI00210350D7|nr:S-formylglutathione hydrolase [Kordiimonas sp. SCSIO 12603]UTW57784.1 S-formylglutathione hydrolase [Kordiimonas sp. SCSIO 12603]